DTHDWTGDDALLEEMWPVAERALAWCENIGDTDGDGWIDYRGARARNQGWKDSDDSLTHVDGTVPLPPAALCEVQAYWYRGLLGMARKRPELKATAAALRKRFNRDFWMPRERFVAQALDGRRQQVRAITSNPGHCLWMGILPAARARRVAQRLMEADLWSGWGIRTLSDLAVMCDPCSYDNGSVWPHDCTLAAAGMRMAGCDSEAELVARTILEAGMSFPDRRPPELWCGTPRLPGEIPDDYRNSCSPQNWAAASTFSLLSTLLGLRADARRGRLRIAPLATPLFKRLEVICLHSAGERLDFAVEYADVRLGPDGGRRGILTAKGAAHFVAGVKVREETEVDVTDAHATLDLLAQLGFQVLVIYRKHRSVWKQGAVNVTLDRLDFGHFVEVEGPLEEIPTVARTLGLDPARAVKDSYSIMARKHMASEKKLARKAVAAVPA